MISVKAPAKINLYLKIKGLRVDGYHELEMLMVPLELSDVLEIEFLKDGGEILLSCSDPTLSVDRSNLVWKAVDLIRKESKRNFGARIHLVKNIPMAAGLGGGSSDAAAVLRAFDHLLGLGWEEGRLRDLGVRLGADVPFFLASGGQWALGIGEELTPQSLPPLFLVLINPGFPLSTADAYRWYDEEFPASFPPPKGMDRSSLKHGLTSGDTGANGAPLLRELVDLLENDLERVALPRHPLLAGIKNSLIQAGALGALMSGSGPTVFGLFASEESRDRGYQALLKTKDPHWWVYQTSTLSK